MKFDDKAAILEELDVFYSDREDFGDYFMINDLGPVLSWASRSGGMVTLTDIGKQAVNESYLALLEYLRVPDEEYENLTKMLEKHFELHEHERTAEA